jgi:hypothetical protein
LRQTEGREDRDSVLRRRKTRRESSVYVRLSLITRLSKVNGELEAELAGAAERGYESAKRAILSNAVGTQRKQEGTFGVTSGLPE